MLLQTRDDDEGRVWILTTEGNCLFMRAEEVMESIVVYITHLVVLTN